MTVDILAPLAERYPGVRAGRIPPEADGPIRAMPLVLRLERRAPLRTAVLDAAAAAALAVCLDPRSAPGGPWHGAVTSWIAGRIRKIARRARGAHWHAVQDLPGVTVRIDPDPDMADAASPAEVRALVPGPVDETPKVVSRLQIGGTDLPLDEPGEPPPDAVLIALNPQVAMTVGKAAAQVGHASMLWAAVRGVRHVPRFAVRTAEPDQWQKLCAAVDRGEAVAVRDAGFTEVDPGTMTCIAVSS